jgi:nitrogen fixation/metabolism regulation signal transduction histidine kinase
MERWLEKFARTAFQRSADTAHDLKTPLNVAVLNLELLRMRVRKLIDGDDKKMNDYGRAIELELRRMADIFDTFFFLSTPPRNESEPGLLDVVPLADQAAQDAQIPFKPSGTAMVRAHEARIRQALRMFFSGASSVFGTGDIEISTTSGDAEFVLNAAGRPASEEFELNRIFKFYYTDPGGNPDLSLASARLIAETYGGQLNASQESDKVNLRFSLPLGEE